MTSGGEERVRIVVNGQGHEIDAGPDVPLLSILRNDLGLSAAKYGCGIGKCGACTVLVDGQARRSCMIQAHEVAGQPVTTLEGLPHAGADASSSIVPLREAFLAEQAAQCGYCIPGILISAVALLETTPAPTRRQIQDALADNLCRCGSQPRIIRAVERAARTIRNESIHIQGGADVRA